MDKTLSGTIMYLNKQILSVTLSFLALAFFTEVYGQNLLLEEASLLERSIEKQIHQSLPVSAGLLMGSDLPFSLLSYFRTTIKEPEEIKAHKLLSLPDPSYAEKALEEAMERESIHYDNHDTPKEETLTAERNPFSDPDESDPDVSTSQQHNGKIPGIVMLVIGDPSITQPLQDGGGNSKPKAPQSDSKDDEKYQTADEEGNTSNENGGPEPKAPPQQETTPPYKEVCDYFGIDPDPDHLDDVEHTPEKSKPIMKNIVVIHTGADRELFKMFRKIIASQKVWDVHGQFEGWFYECNDITSIVPDWENRMNDIVNSFLNGFWSNGKPSFFLFIIDEENIKLFKQDSLDEKPMASFMYKFITTLSQRAFDYEAAGITPVYFTTLTDTKFTYSFIPSRILNIKNPHSMNDCLKLMKANIQRNQ